MSDIAIKRTGELEAALAAERAAHAETKRRLAFSQQEHLKQCEHSGKIQAELDALAAALAALDSELANEEDFETDDRGVTLTNEAARWRWRLKELVHGKDRVLAAHDAGVRADEREKVLSEACLN